VPMALLGATKHDGCSRRPGKVDDRMGRDHAGPRPTRFSTTKLLAEAASESHSPKDGGARRLSFVSRPAAKPDHEMHGACSDICRAAGRRRGRQRHEGRAANRRQRRARIPALPYNGGQRPRRARFSRASYGKNGHSAYAAVRGGHPTIGSARPSTPLT